MGKETFQTGREPQIIVSAVAGDLVVRPWMSLDVEASGTYTRSAKGDALLFEAEGDLVLKVPEGASLSVESVHGDAVIKSLRGSCDLTEVHGDVVLSNLGTVNAGQVHGDLVARNLSGPLTVDAIHGDAVVRGVDGMLQIRQVQGDLVAQFVNGSLDVAEVQGDVTAAAVNGDVTIGNGRRDLNVREIGGLLQAKDIAGDARLRGGLRAGEHVLAAQGDIIVRWPVQLPLSVSILAAEVRNGLPLEDVEESKEGFRGHIGQDGAQLALHAGGKVVLREAELIRPKWSEGMESMFETDFFSELGALGAQIAAEVNQEVGKMAKEFETTIGPNLQKFGDQIAQKANEAAVKARVKADEAAARAQAKAEEAAAKAQAKAEMAAEKAQAKAEEMAARERAAEARAEKQPAETSTAEEQLRILKMVEKGVITPEEANLLLEALEGN